MNSDLRKLAEWMTGRENAKTSAEIAKHLDVSQSQAFYWLMKLDRLRGLCLHRIPVNPKKYYVVFGNSENKPK